MKELISLLPYFKRYKWLLVGGAACVILQNVFNVFIPISVRGAFNAVHQVLISKDETRLSTVILKFAFVVVGLATLRGLFMFLMRQTLIVMSRRMEFDQRNHIYNHYQSLDSTFFKLNRTGDLMARLTEDVSRVRNFTGPALMYLGNLITLIILVVYVMFHVNSSLAVYALIPLPILSLSVYFVNQIINKRSEKIQSQLSNLTTISQETFSGVRVIQSFVQEEAVQLHFEKETKKYKTLSISLAKVEAVYFPLLGLLIGVSTIGVIWKGGHLVALNQISTGHIAEFILYVTMLVWPVTSLGWVASSIQRAIVSQRRINEFLNTKPAIQNSAIDSNLKFEGEIEFKNVSLTYANTGIKALKNVSFKIKAGEKIAIIGKNGIGKSTIAQLLTRMIETTYGEIFIDSKKIKDINLFQLRSHIGYVPQDVFLFSDTVKENILFGTDEKLAQSEIEYFAKMSAIDDEIKRLPNGYETMIGERGVTLSGGQKQRISIARALIKNPSILLLDDCLSAVDASTEATLMQNFSTIFKGKTVINITHRKAHIGMYDKVYELSENGIQEVN
jgi:ATP-binding cassette subfamily B protein